jgi:MoaA/NifB/PqqE/SkfB family radical SAM enzyme
MASDVVTIETGLACNNRCPYCPQQILRSCRPGAGLTTGELEAAIDEAARRGAAHLALTGGEPTVRPDFLHLVAHARRRGFARVSITTNGRMFAYRDLARTAVSAGLTGASVSLHGPDAPTHDAMTGTPGAFGQAVAGIANLRREAGPDGRGLDLSTITVVVRSNASRLRETLTLAGSLGIGLHVVQPFIVSRENLDLAPRYLLDRDELAAALRAALEGGLPHGGRVKPFNIPPCLVSDLGPLVELQEYRVRTRHEHEDGGEAPAPRDRPVQFERKAACAACPHACPGHRLDQVPDAEAAAALLSDASASLATIPGPDATLCGTDLLRPAGLSTVLAGVRRSWPGRLRLLSGAIAASSPAEVADACRAAGVDEVCLLVQPSMLRHPDRKAWLRGNLREVGDALDRFQPGEGPEPSLMLAVPSLASDDCDLDTAGLLELAGRLRSAGGGSVLLFAPERLDARADPLDAAERERLSSLAPDLVAALRDTGCAPSLVRVAPQSSPPIGHSIEESLSTLLPAIDWRPSVIEHRYARTELGWVLWSYPHAVLNAADQG